MKRQVMIFNKQTVGKERERKIYAVGYGMTLLLDKIQQVATDAGITGVDRLSRTELCVQNASTAYYYQIVELQELIEKEWVSLTDAEVLQDILGEENL